jgi:hypothetical protein
MRGFDAVSFVFGLEVTWSLIQQRQQDEEERLALGELECLQEDDEGEDDECGETEDRNTPPKTSLEVAATSSDQIDVDVEISEEVAGEPHEPSSSPCVEAVAVACCDAGSPGENSSFSAPVENNERVAIAEVVADGPTRKETAAAKSTWSCGVCTLMNKKAARKCSACGSKRK